MFAFKNDKSKITVVETTIVKTQVTLTSGSGSVSAQLPLQFLASDSSDKIMIGGINYRSQTNNGGWERLTGAILPIDKDLTFKAKIIRTLTNGVYVPLVQVAVNSASSDNDTYDLYIAVMRAE